MGTGKGKLIDTVNKIKSFPTPSTSYVIRPNFPSTAYSEKSL